MKKQSTLIAGVIFVVMVAVIIICNASGVAFASTFWALVPPLVAIVLALITKEAYSSLFIGIVLGALMNSQCSFLGTVDNVAINGLSTSVSDNAGIFLFLVFLGIVVALVNKSGASRAFGEWAQTHIKTKTGAMLATFFLGVLIFIDDYFNCLTVGSVMSPVTDAKKVSRVKLAYLIDDSRTHLYDRTDFKLGSSSIGLCGERDLFGNRAFRSRNSIQLLFNTDSGIRYHPCRS